MMKLPLETHRYLLEPLSGQKPAMVILCDRFLSFMDKIDKSQKEAIKMGLDPVKTIYCIGDNVCTDIFGANLYDNYLAKRRQDLCSKAGVLGSRSIDDLVMSSGAAHLSGAERCHSVLVETGVFSSGHGPPPSLEHSPRDFLPVESSYKEPTLSTSCVLEAVQSILREQGC